MIPEPHPVDRALAGAAPGFSPRGPVTRSSPDAIASVTFTAACPACGHDSDWWSRRRLNMEPPYGSLLEHTIRCRCPLAVA